MISDTECAVRGYKNDDEVGGEWFPRELYTFSEWCADYDVLPADSPYNDYRVMWDVYGEQYIKECKDRGLGYEKPIF